MVTVVALGKGSVTVSSGTMDGTHVVGFTSNTKPWEPAEDLTEPDVMITFATLESLEVVQRQINAIREDMKRLEGGEKGGKGERSKTIAFPGARR